ncbi:MAG: iron donor protein CyaY [Betaproteobacteria bacterium]|nr:iron donor protein CyaY [Betaproteobacteria bacterium]MDH4322732.1 iron donor protein CyaY [Betaproteobacteria bacterium]MDH5211265.1 iron donor protein CyaY [Betaproteobacteria bacterium]MDH5577511.1 iron donor protein CyaY [Betaproteobacteria bacterium]
MTDAEFESLAEATLSAVERAFDKAAVDADVQTKGAGVLEIEFADGTKMIINRHTAAREIWVAAKSGGFHFRHAGNAWRDTRDGTELYAALSRLVSAQSATPVILAPA